jgi:t-SNARE complex subunit (syntaxin)
MEIDEERDDEKDKILSSIERKDLKFDFDINDSLLDKLDELKIVLKKDEILTLKERIKKYRKKNFETNKLETNYQKQSDLIEKKLIKIIKDYNNLKENHKLNMIESGEKIEKIKIGIYVFKI